MESPLKLKGNQQPALPHVPTSPSPRETQSAELWSATRDFLSVNLRDGSNYIILNEFLLILNPATFRQPVHRAPGIFADALTASAKLCFLRRYRKHEARAKETTPQAQCNKLEQVQANGMRR